MITINKQLDMTPGAIPVVIHRSQYDSDFSIVFTLFARTGDFTIASGTTAKVRGTKKSGTGYSADATIDISAKTVTVAGNQQMTVASGQNIFEIVLLSGTKELCSANFILDVERAALDMDTITDDTVARELDNLDQFVTEAEAAADRAEAAAESVDFDVDPTLTQSGQAADAKVVGDKITSLEEETRNLFYMKPFSKTGLTLTEPSHELYELNGTATSGSYAPINEGATTFELRAGTYVFGVWYEDSTKTLTNACGFYYNTTNSTSGATFITRGALTTITFDSTVYISFRIANNGNVFTAMRFRAMIGAGENAVYVPHISAIDHVARSLTENVAMVSEGNSKNNFIAWDLSTKTLTVNGASFVIGKDGMHSTLKAQSVDFSSVTTTYNAYRILVDSSGYIHGKAWTDDTDTGMFCIGLIYGNTLQIFGYSKTISSWQSVYCFGDSITAGVNCTIPYHLILAQKTGVICLNWGVGSTGFVATASGSVVVGDGVIGDGARKTESGNNTILNIMTGKLFNSCIIFAGTNDYGTNVPISTFRTAVQNTLDYALTQTNNILVITPLKRYYNNVPYTQENRAGHTLKDYADVIIEECETRSIGYVNGFNIDLDPTVAQIKSRLMDDGLHPNNEGQNRVAGAVYSKFLENCCAM